MKQVSPDNFSAAERAAMRQRKAIQQQPAKRKVIWPVLMIPIGMVALWLFLSANASSEQPLVTWPEAGPSTQGFTLQPGEKAVATISLDGNATLTHVPVATYWYEPERDITPYELARILPMFSGPAYGTGEWHTGGKVMPARDVQSNKSVGCVAGVPLFSLAAYEVEDLRTAARHFKKCDQ